jgi:hypothetical protein
VFSQSKIISDELTPAKIREPWLRADLVASWREIIAVLVATLGYYVYCSARIAFNRLSDSLFKGGGFVFDFRPTNYTALHLMAGESAILALLLYYLKWRGWTSADMKIRMTRRTSLQAVPLLIANIVVFLASLFAIYIFERTTTHTRLLSEGRFFTLRSRTLVGSS